PRGNIRDRTSGQPLLRLVIGTDVAQPCWQMWINAPKDCKRSFAMTTLGSAKREPKFSSQSLGQHTSSQSHVSPGNAPNPALSKNLRRDVPSRSADRQDIGIAHCPDIEGQAGVIRG